MGVNWDELSVSHPGVNWDKLSATKPVPNDTSTNAADIGRLGLQGVTGVGGAIGYGLEKTGIAPEFGRTLQDSDLAVQEKLKSHLSPAMQDAAAQPLITDQGEFNSNFGLRSLAANVVPSIPGSIAMGMAGGPLATGATKVLQALGVGAKAAGVVGRGLGFGTSEGVFSGAQNAEQWGHEQRARPISDFARHPAWGQVLQDNNNDPVAAKEALINQGQSDIFKDTTLKTGGLSALTGGGMYGVLRGAKATAADAARYGFLKTTGKSVGTEALQEAPQSYYEQKTTNQATKDYVDPNQDVNQGAVNAGLVGGISGGVMGLGGGVAGLGFRHQTKVSPLTGEPVPEVTPDSGALTNALNNGAVTQTNTADIINNAGNLADQLYGNEADLNGEQATRGNNNVSGTESGGIGERNAAPTNIDERTSIGEPRAAPASDQAGAGSGDAGQNLQDNHLSTADAITRDFNETATTTPLADAIPSTSQETSNGRKENTSEKQDTNAPQERLLNQGALGNTGAFITTQQLNNDNAQATTNQTVSSQPEARGADTSTAVNTQSGTEQAPGQSVQEAGQASIVDKATGLPFTTKSSALKALSSKTAYPEATPATHEIKGSPDTGFVLAPKQIQQTNENNTAGRQQVQAPTTDNASTGEAEAGAQQNKTEAQSVDSQPAVTGLATTELSSAVSDMINNEVMKPVVSKSIRDDGQKVLDAHATGDIETLKALQNKYAMETKRGADAVHKAATLSIKHYDQQAIKQPASNSQQASGQQASKQHVSEQQKPSVTAQSIPDKYKSDMNKEAVSSLLPFNIFGNKSHLLANSIGKLMESAAKSSTRVIDAFGGSGGYTHYLAHTGALPKGSILNEFDPMRAIAHKQIKDNPNAVRDAAQGFEDYVLSKLDIPTSNIGNEHVDNLKRIRTELTQWARDQLHAHAIPGQDYVAKGKSNTPIEMQDNPSTAGLYYFLQSQSFNFIPIQSDTSSTGNFRVPGFAFITIDNKTGKVKKFGRGKIYLDNKKEIIKNASERTKNVDTRRGNGWELIRDEAGKGDLVTVDTSYLNKGKVKTSNYSKATEEDANPDVYLQKVTDNLLPAWERGAKLVITNNWNDDVANTLESLGFHVYQTQRSDALQTGDNNELVALNFDPGTNEIYSTGESLANEPSGQTAGEVNTTGNGNTGQNGQQSVAPGTNQEGGTVHRPDGGLDEPTLFSKKTEETTRFGSKVFNGKLIPWVKTWMWGGDGNAAGHFSFPSDALIRQSSKYVPKKTVTLYRAHDKNIKDSALQSWTHDKDIAQQMAEDSGRELISREFAPEQILIDLSLFDKSVQQHILEHNWDEVIVATGDAAAYIQGVREQSEQAQSKFSKASSQDVGILKEYAKDDDIFRHPISDKITIRGIMEDIAPDFSYVGVQHIGAMTRYTFMTDKAQSFFVMENEGNVWIDVSELTEGSRGNAIYAAVGNYAANTDKVYIGYPEGLTKAAVIARNKAMLSLALRYGRVDFLAPSKEQLKGDAAKGIPPLKWDGDYVDKVSALIDTVTSHLYANIPELKGYKYDFDNEQFEDRLGRPAGKGWLHRIIGSASGRASKAGETTLRQGVFLQSLTSSTRGEKSELLERIQSGMLESARRRGIDGIFSKQQNNVANPHTKASLLTAMRDRLDKEYGKGWSDRLLATDKFKIIGRDEAIAIGGAKAAGAQGFYNAKDDTSYLVAENIGKTDDLKGLLLHEISTHQLSLIRTDPEFQSILKQLENLHKLGNKKVKEAFDRVPKDTNPKHVWEETAAYLVQYSPDLPISRKIIAWFRNAIRAIGKALPPLDRLRFYRWADELDENDIVFIANAALRSAPDSLVFDQVGRNGGIMTSAFAPDKVKPDYKGEYFHGDADVNKVMQSNGLVVIKNPTRARSLKLADADMYSDIRGVVDNATGNLYIASSSSSLHDSIIDAAGLPNNGDYDKLNIPAKAIYSYPRNIFSDDISGDGVKYSFAGQHSATADTYLLDTAKQRLESGEDAEQVRQDTGWSIGDDGKPRYEISDKDAALTNTAQDAIIEANPDTVYSLDEVINHPRLFAAYPAMKNLHVKFGQPGEISGSYHNGVIELGKNNDKILSTLLHEIQHGIQNVEGFARGGSVNGLGYSDFSEHYKHRLDTLRDLADEERKAGNEAKAKVLETQRAQLYYPAQYEAYLRLAGEVEARNTEARMNMSDAERKATSPKATADTPYSDVVVVFSGKRMDNAPPPANANPIGLSKWFNKAKDFVSGNDRSVNSLGDIDSILATGKMPQDKTDMQSVMDKAATMLVDSSRPFDVWTRKLANQVFSGELILAKDRAKRRTAIFEKEAMDNYLKPLAKVIASIAKEHNLDYRAAKELAGQWMTVRYALEKNQDYIRQDQKSVDDAQAALDDKIALDKKELAQGKIDALPANGALKQALSKAKTKQQARLSAINEQRRIDPTEESLASGLAGGYNDFTAQLYKDAIENKIPVAKLNEASKHVYDMLAWKLNKDLADGKVTQAIVDTWHNSPHYVPLTGDPSVDESEDSLFSHGSINQQSDKQAKGRSGSIAQNGIDAATEQVQKSARFHGWADFKDKFTQIYDELIQNELDDGLTQQKAQHEVSKKYGIDRAPETALTRPSDTGLIIRKNGRSWVYDINDKAAMDALRSVNKEDVSSVLQPVAWFTRSYARMVTQLMPGFGAINAIRDTWERSENIRTRALPGYENINMDKVARNAIKTAANPKLIKKLMGVMFEGTKLANKFTVNENDPDIKTIREMISEGGTSTVGDYLSATSATLSKQMKDSLKLSTQAMDVVSAWNNSFELVSSYSIYKALRDAGVDKKTAASGTLNLMNFGKQGTVVGPLKALYVFTNPTMQGGHQLLQTLGTKHGQYRAAAYLVAGIMLYTFLRSGDDDDEIGINKRDELGNFVLERNIPIKIGDNEYFKIPVGFGLPQLAWSTAVNMSKFMFGEQDAVDTGAEIMKSFARTLAPVQPSETSISNHPLIWATQTFTPQIAKPLANIALDVNTFGSPLTNAKFNKADIANALQGRKSTPEAYKMIALELAKFGINVYPEQVREIIKGYAVGPMNEIIKEMVDNPHKESIGRNTVSPLFDRYISMQDRSDLKERLYYRYRDRMNKVMVKKSVGDELSPREESLAKLSVSVKRIEGRANGKLAAASRVEKRHKHFISPYRRQADKLHETAMKLVFDNFNAAAE